MNIFILFRCLFIVILILKLKYNMELTTLKHISNIKGQIITTNKSFDYKLFMRLIEW